MKFGPKYTYQKVTFQRYVSPNAHFLYQKEQRPSYSSTATRDPSSARCINCRSIKLTSSNGYSITLRPATTSDGGQSVRHLRGSKDGSCLKWSACVRPAAVKRRVPVLCVLLQDRGFEWHQDTNIAADSYHKQHEFAKRNISSPHAENLAAVEAGDEHQATKHMLHCVRRQWRHEVTLQRNCRGSKTRSQPFQWTITSSLPVTSHTCILFRAQQPPMGQGFLLNEVSRSHSRHNSR